MSQEIELLRSVVKSNCWLKNKEKLIVKNDCGHVLLREIPAWVQNSLSGFLVKKKKAFNENEVDPIIRSLLQNKLVEQSLGLKSHIFYFSH